MSFPAASYLDEPKSTKRCEQLLLCAGVTCVKPMTIFINLYIYINKIQIYVYNYIFTDYHCIAMLKVHRAHICAPLRILTLKATIIDWAAQRKSRTARQDVKLAFPLQSAREHPGTQSPSSFENLLWTSTLSVHFLQPVQNLLGFSCSIPFRQPHCPSLWASIPISLYDFLARYMEMTPRGVRPEWRRLHTAPLSQCCCLCFSLGIPESRPLSAQGRIRGRFLKGWNGYSDGAKNAKKIKTPEN